MKGVYILLILIEGHAAVNIGSLGEIFFDEGFYVYVGSAQNSLEKRVARHLRRDKRKFWHIDYLLENERTKIVEVFYKEADKKEECRIANKIGEANKPIKGFGSSDCRCESHLFKLNTYDLLTKILRENSFSRLMVHS